MKRYLPIMLLLTACQPNTSWERNASSMQPGQASIQQPVTKNVQDEKYIQNMLQYYTDSSSQVVEIPAQQANYSTTYNTTPVPQYGSYDIDTQMANRELLAFNPGGQYQGYYKVGDPYNIGGKWYYPEDYASYDIVGIASWYGDNFHKNFTANGEVFDQNKVSAAHPTLPLPSIVKVTNMDNNREMYVRVNDRGPFIDNRVIDLSRKAAEYLGVVQKGTANVRIEYDKVATQRMLNHSTHAKYQAIKDRYNKDLQLGLVDENYWRVNMANLKEIGAGQSTPKIEPYRYKASGTKPQQTAITGGKKYVQVGAFSDFDLADGLQQELFGNFRNAYTERVNVGGSQLFRVKVGPFTEEASAAKVLNTIKSYGHNDAIITSN